MRAIARRMWRSSRCRDRRSVPDGGDGAGDCGCWECCWRWSWRIIGFRMRCTRSCSEAREAIGRICDTVNSDFNAEDAEFTEKKLGRRSSAGLQHYIEGGDDGKKRRSGDRRSQAGSERAWLRFASVKSDYGM